MTLTTTYDDEKINQIIERAVGFYYEKTKHDIGLVLEATDFIKEQLERKIDRDEFNEELKAETKTIRLALTDTNRELRALDKRVTRLETTRDD